MSVTVAREPGSGVARVEVRAGAEALSALGAQLLALEADDSLAVVVVALPDGLPVGTCAPVGTGELLRWRNLRKVTVAEVRGDVSARALAVAWCCDLIVAAAGTRFVDIAGAAGDAPELPAHAYELGPRLAKELLWLGDPLEAEEAADLGMVAKVFPADSIERETAAFAARLAALPTITGLLVKDAVNQSVDAMGYENAVRHAAEIWARREPRSEGTVER